MVSLNRGIVNVQVREALLALPGGLSEARPIAELQRRMADLQAQVTARPLEPDLRSDASTVEYTRPADCSCRSVEWNTRGHVHWCFTDQADALEGRAVPRPTPSQFTALAAKAANFVTAGAGSPERIAALVSGLQVSDQPDTRPWHQACTQLKSAYGQSIELRQQQSAGMCYSAPAGWAAGGRG